MCKKFFLNKIIYLLFIIYVFFPQQIFADVNSDVTISAQVLTSTTNNNGTKTGSFLNLPTVLNFSGLAYPQASVYVIKDGNLIATTVASQSGNFSISVSGLDTNVYTFSVYAVDGGGRKSSFFSFPIYIIKGTNVNISNIFLSPTIDVDKIQVKKGDLIKIFGQSLPLKEVLISVFFGKEYTYRVIANELGLYFYNLDTSILKLGKYQTKSKTINYDQMSLNSMPVSFLVGDKNILKDQINCSVLRGDLNCDDHVNLTDFSIMAYWHKKINPPTKIDLNNDGVITLVDFSIMAFNWTG